MAMRWWRRVAPVADVTIAWLPEMAMESPNGVRTRRKKRTIAAKKMRDTKSRKRHRRIWCLEDVRSRWAIDEDDYYMWVIEIWDLGRGFWKWVLDGTWRVSLDECFLSFCVVCLMVIISYQL
ncbi:hypothetical protein Hanom_Chr04g00368721 [Helianthus anomalus]